MIRLSKNFSREMTLFNCYVWHEANRKYQREWFGFNVRNILFLKENRTNIVTVWYEQRDPKRHRAALRKKVQADPRYLSRVKKAYRFYLASLFPYVRGRQGIRNIGELEQFYRHYLAWWSPMAVIFVLGDTPGVPARIRNEALRLRSKDQDYPHACNRIFIHFLRKHYPRYKNLAFVITPAEVFSLKHGTFSASKVLRIQRRLRGYALFNGELLVLRYLPRRLRKSGINLEGLNARTEVTEGDVLRGMVVSRGVVRGKVRIVNSEKGLGKLKRGEVLVATMTSPQFMSAMRKAAAIVTDEGGMTSHAAIVSREMGKPCIVGTKVATQVLRDGDKVEVDANKGIVKILKRNGKN